MLVLLLFYYQVTQKVHQWKPTNTHVPCPLFSVKDFDQSAISIGGRALASARTDAFSLHRRLQRQSGLI